MSEKNLYQRLGGYDAISAVVNNLLDRLVKDNQLERFWLYRGDDGLKREKQLLIDYLCANAGGPLLYVGRGNKIAHKGMGVTERDWACFMDHLEETLDHFEPAPTEREEVLAFVHTTKSDIVE